MRIDSVMRPRSSIGAGAQYKCLSVSKYCCCFTINSNC